MQSEVAGGGLLYVEGGARRNFLDVQREIQRLMRENKWTREEAVKSLTDLGTPAYFIGAKDNFTPAIDELQQKFTPKQRAEILFGPNDSKTSLQQWIDQYVKEDPETGRITIALPDWQDSFLCAFNEQFIQMPPPEISIVLRMAGSLLSHGDPDAFITLMNFYLEVYEQHLTLAVAGMSVGGEIVERLVQRFPIWDRVRIADPKTLHPTNGNRVPYFVDEEGMSKGEFRERNIHGLTPWIWVENIAEGVTLENAHQFVDGACVVFDEMDSISGKMALRQAARKAGVPVVMLTDAGNHVVREVRRFDLDNALPLFATLSDKELSDLLKEVSKEQDLEKKRQLSIALVRKIVGEENIPAGYKGDLDLLSEGSTNMLPQPSETVLEAQKVAIFTVRELLNGNKLPEIHVFVVEE